MRRFIVDDEDPTVETSPGETTLVPGQVRVPAEAIPPWSVEARTELGGGKSTRALREAMQLPTHDDSEEPAPQTLWTRIALRLGLSKP